MIDICDERFIAEALRFMGVPASEREGGAADEVKAMFGELEAVITPRKVWGRFPLSVGEGSVSTAGFEIASRDLARLLSGSHECFLMAVTIGSEADRRISAEQRRGILRGMTADACASVLADALCDELEAELAETLQDGERLTERFSPGYGDAPLSASADIIRALDASRRIGLFMTNAMMMTPVKSITAIAGITRREAPRIARGCDTCAARDGCALRRRGERCYEQK